MHHVRVALDEHQPLHLHRAVLADAAQIVAAQVHEHDVFGALLRIGQKFALRAPGPPSRCARADACRRSAGKTRRGPAPSPAFRASCPRPKHRRASENKDTARDSPRAARDKFQTDRRWSPPKIAGSAPLEKCRRRECIPWLCRTAAMILRLRDVRSRRAAARAACALRLLRQAALRACGACARFRARRRHISARRLTGPSVKTLRMIHTRCRT